MTSKAILCTAEPARLTQVPHRMGYSRITPDTTRMRTRHGFVGSQQRTPLLSSPMRGSWWARKDVRKK